MTYTLILDTETTGIFPRDEWAECCELGAVMLDDATGDEVASFSRLVRPSILDERCDEAMSINHIDRAILLQQPDARAVARDFAAWAAPYRAQINRVTSYNVAFDRLAVEKMGLRGVPWGDCLMVQFMRPMADAGKLVPKKYPKPREGVTGIWIFPKLSVAAAFFGVEVQGQPHRALTDARTAAAIWRKMLFSDAPAVAT